MLQIDLALPDPAYEQITNGLRALLVSGEFHAGDQLPPVRQLAIDLGVHHNTVAEAYRLLAAEGWLDLRRGRGAMVLERPMPRAMPGARSEFARRLSELAAKAITEGVPAADVAAELESLARRVRERGIP